MKFEYSSRPLVRAHDAVAPRLPHLRVLLWVAAFWALSVLFALTAARCAQGAEPRPGLFGLLPVFHEDKPAEFAEAKARQLRLFEESVAREAKDAPRLPREWAALMFAVLENETRGSLRIHEGRCKPRECDRGRARGPWQNHRNTIIAPVWDKMVGVENTPIQAHAASEMLKRAYWTCQRFNPDWVAGTLSAYAGRSCHARWDGLAPRVASYRKFVGSAR